MTRHGVPMAMGAAMGLMLLWLVHGALVDGGGIGMAALLAFVGGHLVAILVAVALAGRVARRSAWFRRLHRPSALHLASMALSAIGSAGLVHLSLHGLS